jgi:hypothetical protein
MHRELVRANKAATLIGLDERTFCDAVELAAVKMVFDRNKVAHFRVADLDRVRNAVARLPAKRQRYVYVVRSGKAGAFKIGIAWDVERRLCGLQTTSPRQLRLIHHEAGGGKVERAAHKALAAHRLKGEWFRPHPEVLAFVEKVKTIGIAAVLNLLVNASLDNSPDN